MVVQKKQRKNVDDYIDMFPDNTKQILKKFRQAIQESASKAEETISYGIPTYRLNGNLVHFGGFKNHVGFYPAPQAITFFEKELSLYKTSKGTIQFSLDKPIPYDLVKKIVKYRVKENLKKNHTTKTQKD